MPSQTSTRSRFARAPLFRAADLGLTSGAISARVKRGTLHRVHRGVYSLVPREALTRESRWLAALMAVGDDAALARLTAAVHWRAWRWPGPAIEVVVPRYRRSTDGRQVHECRNLDPRDVTTHRGIRGHDGRADGRRPHRRPDRRGAHELPARGGVPAAALAAATCHGGDGARRTAVTTWRGSRRPSASGGAGAPGSRAGSNASSCGWWSTPGSRSRSRTSTSTGSRSTRTGRTRGSSSRSTGRTTRGRRRCAATARVTGGSGCTVLRFTELELEQRPLDVVSAVTVHLAGLI